MLRLFPDPATASYAVNAVFYAAVGVFALASAWRIVGRDVKILGTRPWFTLGMVPLAVVVMLILTALLVAALRQARLPKTSWASKASCSRCLPWLMVPLLVVLGPFVEEYLFRHLLIGKLSQVREHLDLLRHFRGSLSPSIHVVGSEGLALSALAPYLGMAACAGGGLCVDGKEPDVLLLRPCGQEPPGRGSHLCDPAGLPPPLGPRVLHPPRPLLDSDCEQPTPCQGFRRL